MPLSWPEKRSRLDAAAQAKGWTSYNEQRRFTAALRRDGLPLSNSTVKAAVSEFARFYARREGIDVPTRSSKDLMLAFRQEAERRNLTHRWNDAPIVERLVDRGIVDMDDGGWDEWWERDTPGS